jgi:hypothetical protein
MFGAVHVCRINPKIEEGKSLVVIKYTNIMEISSMAIWVWGMGYGVEGNNIQFTGSN